MSDKEKHVNLRVTPQTRDKVLAQRKKDPSKRGGIESADEVLRRHLTCIYVEYDLSTLGQGLEGKTIKEAVIRGPDPYTMTVITEDGVKVNIEGKAETKEEKA